MAIFGRSFPIRGRVSRFSLFSTGVYTLTADAGSYGLAGAAATYGDAQACVTGDYLISGFSVAFTDRLAPSAGSYAVTGTAAAFGQAFAAAAGSYGLSSIATSFAAREAATAGAYALAGVPVAEAIGGRATVGAYALTGRATADTIAMVGGAAAYAWTLAPVTRYTLSRTGDDVDQVYGGIGHYLVELEEKRRLAAITRTTPPPIDRTTQPIFRPVAIPPLAPKCPIDLAATLAARMVEHRAMAQRAAMTRRRRQEVEILLLAC
jgi:hypothetical protein